MGVISQGLGLEGKRFLELMELCLKRTEGTLEKDQSFEGPILGSIFSSHESMRQHGLRMENLGLGHWGKNAKEIEAPVGLSPGECWDPRSPRGTDVLGGVEA